MLPHLMTGDVVMVRNPFHPLKPLSWVSTLIRFFTGSHYNHAKLIVINWGSPFVIEALARGITSNYAPYNLKGKKILILRPKEPIKGIEAFSIKANSFIGVAKYDFLVTFWVQLIYQTLGIWIKPKQEGTDAFNCTNFIAYMYNWKQWWKASPYDIVNSDKFYEVYKN